MTANADIDRLAASIAALVTAQARSSDFWDMDDIAYHLRASKSTAMKWATMPDFPNPIRPPTDGAGKGHPRFLPAEVRRWAMSHREGAQGRVGRPRKGTA
jgi:alkylhydroperoxidase family enzyme